MKNKFFDAFFKYHAGSDNKLQINLAWPYHNGLNIAVVKLELSYRRAYSTG